MFTIAVIWLACLCCAQPEAKSEVGFTIGTASEYSPDALGMVINPKVRPATLDDYQRLVCRIIRTDSLESLPIRSRHRYQKKQVTEYREVRMLFYLNDVIPFGTSGEGLEAVKGQLSDNFLGEYYFDEAGGTLSVGEETRHFTSKDCATEPKVTR